MVRADLHLMRGRVVRVVDLDGGLDLLPGKAGDDDLPLDVGQAPQADPDLASAGDQKSARRAENVHRGQVETTSVVSWVPSFWIVKLVAPLPVFTVSEVRPMDAIPNAVGPERAKWITAGLSPVSRLNGKKEAGSVVIEAVGRGAGVAAVVHPQRRRVRRAVRPACAGDRRLGRIP